MAIEFLWAVSEAETVIILDRENNSQAKSLGLEKLKRILQLSNLICQTQFCSWFFVWSLLLGWKWPVTGWKFRGHKSTVSYYWYAVMSPWFCEGWIVIVKNYRSNLIRHWKETLNSRPCLSLKHWTYRSKKENPETQPKIIIQIREPLVDVLWSLSANLPMKGSVNTLTIQQ